MTDYSCLGTRCKQPRDRQNVAYTLARSLITRINIATPLLVVSCTRKGQRLVVADQSQLVTSRDLERY